MATLKELEARRVSLIALNGMAFDLTTPHGRMMATLLAGIAKFERELTVKLIRPGTERNWRDLKRHHLARHTFKDDADIICAIHAAVKQLNKERMTAHPCEDLNEAA